jgi:VWFA-related protein
MLVLLAAGAGAAGSAQQPPAQPPSPSGGQSFTATTTAILVDVVVRDRKNRPVMDLAAADFEVYEDGVRQQVDSFSRVSRGDGIGVGIAFRSPTTTVAIAPSSGPATAETTPPPEEGATALVFDHLSAETLRLAQRAALEYVPTEGESGVRVAVFATDPGIRVLQRYTHDRSLIRRGVERVIPTGSIGVDDQKGERTDELMARRRELGTERESAAAGAATGAGSALAQNAAQLGQRETELRMIQTELNMLRSFDNLERDYRGYDTVRGLFAVVQSLSHYPGRKTVVFFSEGLPVSPAMSARLDNIIDAANRSNVTTYAIDANGLRAKSSLARLQKEIDGFAEERLMQIASGQDRTDQPLTMAFERVEDTLKLDSRTGLARLAADTGGFLVDQSNDLASAFRRIDEDNRFHYLLTYSPKQAAFDGKFHEIDVKVKRSGTQVFARKGYRAVGAPGRIDTGGYEIPALAMLERGPLPNAFPVYASGFSFPDLARPGLTPVVVKVRTGALQFTIDQARAAYSGQAAVVVRIKDGAGDEVQRLSQQYILSGDAKDVEAAKQGEILFYREVDLLPGVYTMESIVFDAASRKGSARVATLTVPKTDPAALGMSSLILVGRIEETDDVPGKDSDKRPPLYVGRALLYPNLGEPIRKSVTNELPFYFALYGRVAGAGAVAQLLRNGEPLAETPVELPPATGSRVQHVGRLPVASLPAGTYELRIRVTGGAREVSQSAFFTLYE